jgi:PAS domain S-box-containing protein
MAVVREAEEHAVQFYTTDTFLSAAVTRFVAEGARAGEPAVIIATPDHRDGFVRGLTAAGIDVSRMIADESLVLLDAQETLATFMVDGAPRWELFDASVGGVVRRLAAARPAARIRAYGEMVDVLWRAGQSDAAIRLEEMWNVLRGQYAFQLLCAYVIDSFYKESGIPRICGTHSHVLPPEDPGAHEPSSVADTVHSLVAEIARRNELEQALRESLRRAHRAEAEALAAKDDLEEFLTEAIVPIHRVDRAGIIRWANAAELALVGYAKDEYIGRPIAEFHADRDAIEDMLARLSRGETLRDYEARIRTKSGEIRTVQVSSNVQLKHGQFETTRCFSRDVTDEKRIARRTAMLLRLTTGLSRALSAEQAARVLIEETRSLVGAEAGGVLLLDQTGSRIERLILHGDADRDALRDVSLADDLPICEAARTGNLIWVAGKRQIEARYPHLRLSAGTWGAVPISFEGRLVAAIGFRCAGERPIDAHDESLLLAVAGQCGQAIERARLHEAEQTARAAAEQASRAKDEFLAILGHELRNPLSPILTAVQLMRLRGEVSSQREQDIIERQVDHLIHLVDDLLDISRVARGKVTLETRALTLQSVIARAIEIASPQFEKQGHRVDVELPDRAIWLEADETRLCQVLTNLLSNAAKYTPPRGHVQIRVAVAGARAEVRVRDNGSGIAPELLPRIFDLFVQGERSSDRQPGGLGIGLALVRNLVRLHGGTVRATSEGVGRGSEFIIELPILDTRPVRAASRDHERNLRDSVEVTPRRILVVDDNEEAGRLLAEVLRTFGHEVATAIDGPAALEAVKRFTPEVGILDICLPVVDGYELASMLRDRLGSAVRLVAVTGYGQEHDKHRALASGFESHLVKPVSLQKLLAAIEVSRRPSP